MKRLYSNLTLTLATCLLLNNIALKASPPPAKLDLISYFPLDSTVVTNSAGASLPKSVDKIPSLKGAPDYRWGNAFLNSAGGKYQSGENYNKNSLTLLPPSSSMDFIKVFFYKPTQAELDLGYSWMFQTNLGIASALGNSSRGVRVQVIVSGDRIDSTDLPWQVLDDFKVFKDKVLNYSTPLGTWPLRKNFYLALQVSALGPNNYFDNLILDSPSIIPTTQRPTLGIVQPDLIWDSNPIAKVDSIQSLGANWIRTNIRSIDTVSKYVEIVREANQKGLKVLANILQEEGDYAPNEAISYANAGEDFNKLCGWSSGALRFSWLNVSLFSKRLETHLKQLQAAKASVHAFEIGNELDWACFNGDISLGTGNIITSADMKGFLEKYAMVLSESQRLIKLYYPTADVITFGAANCYLFTKQNCIQDPVNLLIGLKSINGKNHLNDATGIGMHLYPDSKSIWDARTTLISYSNALGNTAPFWVTEWGFRSLNEADRYVAYKSFLEYMNMTWWIPISKLFLFSYQTSDSYGLVDSNAAPYPSARVVMQYRKMLGQ